MTLVRMWSSYAVMVMAQSYICAATACAETATLADESTLVFNAPAAACSSDDACGAARLQLYPSLRINIAEALAQDGVRIVFSSERLHLWKSVPMDDLVAYNRPTAKSSNGMLGISEARLHIAQDPSTTSPPSDARAHLKELVRKQLGGWAPTGLNTVIQKRKKIGVSLRIRFR